MSNFVTRYQVNLSEDPFFLLSALIKHTRFHKHITHLFFNFPVDCVFPSHFNPFAYFTELLLVNENQLRTHLWHDDDEFLLLPPHTLRLNVLAALKLNL